MDALDVALAFTFAEHFDTVSVKKPLILNRKTKEFPSNIQLQKLYLIKHKM